MSKTKVLVVDNAHLYKTPDGKYYTPSIYSYDFFQRYLNVFEEVRFAAKTKCVDQIDISKYLLVSGDNLEIYELPWYRGLKGLLKNLPQLIKQSRNACEGCSCYIYRIAQIESFMIYLFGKTKRRPFAVEVVNDPSVCFSDNFFFKTFVNIFMKRMLYKANGASYLTSEILQKSYPSRAHKNGNSDLYFTSNYPTIDLDDDDIYQPKVYKNTLNQLKILHVSNTFNDEKKGHYTVIDIVQNLNKEGYSLTADFIGDGPALETYIEYATKLKINDKIHFLGRYTNKKELLKKMHEYDIFVFPSHSEGQGRVIIEAQAAGLPCLSTKSGGILELIEAKYLFEINDVRGYADTIKRLILKPSELEEMSKNNIENSKQFLRSRLIEKRSDFYNKLRNCVRLSTGIK